MTLDAALPIAGRTVISLDPGHYGRIRRTTAAAFRLARGEAWQALMDARAQPHLRFAPGDFGVLMATTSTSRRRARASSRSTRTRAAPSLMGSILQRSAIRCLCADLLPVEVIEERLVAQLPAGFEAVRGAGARPRGIAIADEKPHEQFLRPECEMIAELFERRGIAARICDIGELAPGEDGELALLSSPDVLAALAVSAEERAWSPAPPWWRRAKGTRR